MYDLRFYHLIREITTGELADYLGAELRGNPDQAIVSVAPPKSASPGALCYFSRSKAGDSEISKNAAVCLIREDEADLLPDGVAGLLVPEPSKSFAIAAEYFLGRREIGVPQNDLGPAVWADSAVVQHGAVICDGAEIGENSRIGVNAIIGPGVRIGRDCEIGPGAVVEAALIGNGVRLKANSVIGGTGFGLIPTNTGILSAPHFGRVILQDKVSLGSCVCVDRGMFDDTVIGEGSQIDNHVHIGHNVQIGRNCVIAAFGGLSGSVVIEDGVQMGGRVGIADHVRIGQGARLAADAAIMRDIPANETWGGSPAKPFRQWMKETAWLSKAVKTRTRSSDK
ncbi:MAG: UDP-3-O-(3-hydroxymyristoyl)glucosamine N-acyltransferase [Ponticaulis sp.]|nr:UDP-3-O-(3-hydroxymyristoyl)glucosamine N-acyltransferase [Ponticaulis sp.]|tara:strand:- start:47851 stop:48867 length:1017 start_codon:yes stop_codon:yes gene_type:complete